MRFLVFWILQTGKGFETMMIDDADVTHEDTMSMKIAGVEERGLMR